VRCNRRWWGRVAGWVRGPTPSFPAELAGRGRGRRMEARRSTLVLTGGCRTSSDHQDQASQDGSRSFHCCQPSESNFVVVQRFCPQLTDLRSPCLITPQRAADRSQPLRPRHQTPASTTTRYRLPAYPAGLDMPIGGWQRDPALNGAGVRSAAPVPTANRGRGNLRESQQRKGNWN